MNNNKISLLNGNSIELHYWFNDSSHIMDAIIHNKCEYELLGIIKEVALAFEAEIIIETEPLANGGIRRYFKIVSKSEKKSAVITTAIIVALVTGIFITPITTSISKVTEQLIEKIFEDKELKELEKEKLKLEIEKLKQETGKKTEFLNQNTVIKKRKSNFYKSLEECPKIEKISITIESENKTPLSDENFVYKNNFKEYILVSNDLEPVKIDNAIIEIISPVLKKGKYKWMGIYNGESIPFNMKSNEFKTLVQTGEVEFKNGSSIDCYLEVRKKIDNEGLGKTVGHDVMRVNRYFENEKPIETSEGKKHRQQKEADEQQLKLFEE